jgi:threonine/homoserine/homoserine lactone efflux protein
MAASQFLAFLGVSVLVIVTPGQDTALTIKNALLGERRGGIFTALGVSTGQAVWALAAAVGVAALLSASEPAFLAVKLVGAAYLVYLGGQALLRAVGGRAALAGPRSRAGPSGIAPATAFRQGVLSNLANPKMAVFFTSLLPQFAGEGSFLGLLFLGLVFCSLTFVWLAGYAVVVAAAGDFLRRTGIRRLFDALTGAVLVALGLRVATSR